MWIGIGERTGTRSGRRPEEVLGVEARHLVGSRSRSGGLLGGASLSVGAGLRCCLRRTVRHPIVVHEDCPAPLPATLTVALVLEGV